MIPEPLHPAIVHFPIVLAVLLPIFALGALWAIRGGASVRRAWGVAVLAAAVLAASAFVAVRTGEAQEDRVESVVGEAALHEHEEAGERFLVLSAVLALVMATGLAGGPLGRAGRWVGTAGAVVLVAAAVQVGAAGGELVYQHGAASAYVDTTSGPDAAPARAVDREDREEGDR